MAIIKLNKCFTTVKTFVGNTQNEYLKKRIKSQREMPFLNSTFECTNDYLIADVANRPGWITIHRNSEWEAPSIPMIP